MEDGVCRRGTFVGDIGDKRLVLLVGFLDLVESSGTSSTAMRKVSIVTLVRVAFE